MKSTIGMTLAAIGFATASGAASAGVTIDITDIGTGVVVNASGSLNLDGLTETFGSFLASAPGMVDFGGDLRTSQGLLLGNPVGSYSLRAAPGPVFDGSTYPFFGAERDSQTQLTLSDATGNLLSLGYFATGDRVGIGLASDYVSGDPIVATGRWDAVDLARLGITDGTSHTWTWGAGPTSDFLTIQVSAVPEPSSYALFMAGLGLVGMVARRGRRR